MSNCMFIINYSSLNSLLKKLRQQGRKVHCLLGGTELVTHQEDLIGTFTERGVVRAVHWSLAGELGVKLADVISRLLPEEADQLIILKGQVTRGYYYVKDELTRKGLNGGSTLRARRSSQFICRKNRWAWERR